MEPLPAVSEWIDRWKRLAPRARLFAAIAAVLVVAVAGAVIAQRVLAHRQPPVEASIPRTQTATTSGPGPSASVTAKPLADVVVYVVGAVVAPGVFSLPAGARVLDAIAAAGGHAPDADLTAINLATKLFDGVRVWVPHVGQQPPPSLNDPVTATGGADPGIAAGPINLNTATAGELESLPGIGQSIAAAILRYRDQHGPFGTVSDLTNVSGIGPAKLERVRSLVTV